MISGRTEKTPISAVRVARLDEANRSSLRSTRNGPRIRAVRAGVRGVRTCRAGEAGQRSHTAPANSRQAVALAQNRGSMPTRLRRTAPAPPQTAAAMFVTQPKRQVSALARVSSSGIRSAIAAPRTGRGAS
ncbi:hypothetical protein Slala03_74820 [Streptomyces lavendulae subsp. lavendulae]|nr:hypothetical protein Slala03_74820 [Streptomyces lavendulae subsp. lavendulae]